jgi:hypothetical protein
MAIGGYFIGGYGWLLMATILLVIGGYFIHNYWWLNYHKPLVAILL